MYLAVPARTRGPGLLAPRPSTAAYPSPTPDWAASSITQTQPSQPKSKSKPAQTVAKPCSRRLLSAPCRPSCVHRRGIHSPPATASADQRATRLVPAGR
ncbi:hypothetical protein ACSS6W_008783 [Trichoderma asperelloides]